MKQYISKSFEKTLKVCDKDTSFNKAKMNQSIDGYKYIKQFYDSDIEIYESIFLLLLNRQNNTIGWVKIGQGGVCATICDIKIIGKYILDTLATGIILAHNHPSGNKEVSEHDKILTKGVKEVCNLLEVSFLDHIILLPDDNYVSMADQGLM